MIAVGIDVSKSKSMVAVLDSYGTVLASPYTVNHDATDMNALVAYLKGFDEPVKNVMKIKGNEMTLTKRGIINVQMNFEAGKKNLTRYQTPYGVMMIGLDTSRVVCLQEEKSLAIEIDYTLEANYQYVSDSKIRIMVRERKQQA